MTMSFVGLRKFWYAISGTLVVLSVAALAVWGLRLNIEFTGGALAEYTLGSASVSTQEVRDYLVSKQLPVESVITAGNGVQIRMAALTEAQRSAFKQDMTAKWSEAQELRYEAIGPSVSAELRSKAFTAILVTLFLVLAYVTWAYRKVSGRIPAWKYGLLVVITSVHDVVIPLGVFAALGHFAGVEVGGSFIAALLTIMGYSISDTVVVFDRVRENTQRVGGEVGEIVERSIRETLWRSLNTSLTTLLALGAIFFFGGESTKSFALTLIIGLAAGTYSSIFIASPLLVDMQAKPRE